MKPSILLLTFLLSFASLQAQDWKYYKYENLEFKASFPSAPKKSIQKVQTAVGELDMHVVMLAPTSGDDNTVYSVIRSDYPAEQFADADKEYNEKVLDGAVEGARVNVNGTLEFDKEITFNGFPARNIKIKINDGFIYINAVLSYNSMFITQVVCTTSNDNNPNIQKFLKSFEIIKTKE